MNGTIITDVNVYKDGQAGPVMNAKVGDKVKGSGTTITELTRNGTLKLSGTYTLGQTGCVAWDEVTPPPDPTGMQNMRLTDLDTGQSWDFVRKPSV